MTLAEPGPGPELRANPSAMTLAELVDLLWGEAVRARPQSPLGASFKFQFQFQKLTVGTVAALPKVNKNAPRPRGLAPAKSPRSAARFRSSRSATKHSGQPQRPTGHRADQRTVHMAPLRYFAHFRAVRLPNVPKGKPRFHFAVNCFDDVAERIRVFPTSVSSHVMGIELPPEPEPPSDEATEAELFNRGGLDTQGPLSRCFGNLLRDMAGDQAFGGQAFMESLPRVRSLLFNTLLPVAEAHAAARLKHSRVKAREAELEADQKAKEATVQPEVVLGPPSPKPSKGGLKRTRIYSGDSGEVSQVGSQSQSVASSPAGKRVGMRASLAAAAEAAEREAREKEEELARDDAADAALAKQTLPGSIVKAETLMNQLLEPEVVHLFAMFLGTFELLFANYSDVPTRAGKGHMTIFAFTRFCFDFGLFPTMIDLKSLQQIYGLIAKRGTEEIAIAAVATAMAEMAEMAESRNGDEGNAALDRGGTASSAGGLSRPRLLSQSKSSPSVGLRRSGRYLSSQLAISEETVVDPDGPDGLIFWNGIQIPRRLSWISKESADLSEAEGNCFAVLSAINDWLKDRSVKIHEFFLFLDTDGSGKISVEEMQAGLTFMRFFDPPSPEEVAEFFPLIASPETGEIAIWELQQSLVIISKQKTKLELARAGFMKLDSQMSSAELKASIFFKDLAVVMQRNKWTPEEMFQQFDLDGSGDVGQDELTSRAKKLLANSCGRCPGLDILSPFELLDTNGDGVVSQSEFCGLMLDLRKAQLMMDEQGLRNKLKLVTANAVLDSERRAALLADDKAKLHSRLTSGGSTRRASNASTAAKQ
ncbi:unnamed protein product [Polarella glacialis]|uniref:EF-hand domain-containing protein n=1 Tax=Polarella glacialis TaxID=89957 RepID=A0A813I4T1_POLGL|nr:unnamed protein product [Polarella glacialis]